MSSFQATSQPPQLDAVSGFSSAFFWPLCSFCPHNRAAKMESDCGSGKDTGEQPTHKPEPLQASFGDERVAGGPFCPFSSAVRACAVSADPRHPSVHLLFGCLLPLLASAWGAKNALSSSDHPKVSDCSSHNRGKRRVMGWCGLGRGQGDRLFLSASSRRLSAGGRGYKAFFSFPRPLCCME